MPPDRTELASPNHRGAASGKFKTAVSGAHAIRGERTILLAARCEVGSDLLEPLRVFVGAYAAQRFRPWVAQSITLATNELLENALNYGSVSGDVEFQLLRSGNVLAVEVCNDAVPSRVSVLSERVARLREDAEAAYLEEMARSVSGRIGRPMLGLARVSHEGKMQLELAVNERRVTVTASCLA